MPNEITSIEDLIDLLNIALNETKIPDYLRDIAKDCIVRLNNYVEATKERDNGKVKDNKKDEYDKICAQCSSAIQASRVIANVYNKTINIPNLSISNKPVIDTIMNCAKEIDDYLINLDENKLTDKQKKINLGEKPKETLGNWLSILNDPNSSFNVKEGVCSNWELRKKCAELAANIDITLNSGYLTGDSSSSSFFEKTRDILKKTVSGDEQLSGAQMALEQYIRVVFNKGLKEFFNEVKAYREPSGHGLK